MKVYKAVTGMTTHGGQQWEVGVPVEIAPELRDPDAPSCSPAWLHCYADSTLAAILLPAHVSWWKRARIFEAEAGGKIRHEADKVLCTRLTLKREIDLPKLTVDQRVEFGIRAARRVYAGSTWNEWTERWLSGEDRSCAAAYAAVNAAHAAYAYAAHAAYAYAAHAAYAAANAAADAAYAAARTTAYAAYAAADAYAAHAAYAAANAAADAAYAAADAYAELLTSVLDECAWWKRNSPADAGEE